MPKKFVSENPKAAAARDRKETTKKVETEKKQKAADDAQWADDDKLVNRKLQRKDDEEQKRADLLKRKEENRRLAEEEMNSIQAKSTAQASKKITRAEIEKQRAVEMLAKMQEEKLRKMAALKIQEVTTIEDNVNQATADVASARNVDEAIEVLGVTDDDFDKHPEKRMKAAYLAFEERRLPELKEEHPTYRLSQLKQQLRKEWQKSPENPINIKLLAMASQ